MLKSRILPLVMITENLFKISLSISIAGILLLLFLANFLEPKLIKIQDIEDKMLNKKVKIQGSIIKIQDKETFQILTIVDETKGIDILCECNIEEIKKAQEIEVIGRVKEYKQALQIQADSIRKK